MWKSIATFLKQLQTRGFDEDRQVESSIKSKILNTHFIKIPDVSSFRVRITGWNKIFEHFGLLKRKTPILEFKPHRNKEYNRYMERQIKRLRSFKTQPEKFFRIMFFLMEKSMVFRVSAINKSMKNWHRFLPLWYVLRVSHKVDELIKTRSYLLDFKRVYIPKANGKLRPLGVPTYPWRIYLQLFNNFLYIYLEDYFLPSQHGFIPNRGTLTAWQEVFEKVSRAQYVYEFDLKQFFPSVDLKTITDRLISLKVPKEVAYLLEEINLSQPRLPSNFMSIRDKLRESGIEEDVKLHRTDWRTSFAQMGYDMLINPFEVTRLYSPKKSVHRPDLDGVPQGSNTGPLLSMVAIKDFLSQENSISYADDGLFYSEKPFTIKDLPDQGINLHPEKSGWVKIEGNWVKELKFLGLLWKGDSLRANTRKGSVLIADDMQSALGVIASAVQGKTPDYNMSWEGIFKSGIGGFTISKLYSGSWSLEEYLSSNRFNYTPLSMMSKCTGLFDLYNASSAASYSLIKVLRKGKNHRKYLYMKDPFVDPFYLPQGELKERLDLSLWSLGLNGLIPTKFTANTPAWEGLDFGSISDHPIAKLWNEIQRKP